MKIAFFCTRDYDRQYFDEANTTFGHELSYYSHRLSPPIALQSLPVDAVCVLITGHQGYFTEDALRNIATTSLQNATAIEQGLHCDNEVTSALLRPPCVR